MPDGKSKVLKNEDLLVLSFYNGLPRDWTKDGAKHGKRLGEGEYTASKSKMSDFFFFMEEWDTLRD